MDRVVVTKCMVGICHMQVCAIKDATDNEILDACNRVNPSGTENGWGHVIRDNEPPSEFWPVEDMKPKKCGDNPQRLHLFVSC